MQCCAREQKLLSVWTSHIRRELLKKTIPSRMFSAKLYILFEMFRINFNILIFNNIAIQLPFTWGQGFPSLLMHVREIVATNKRI